MELIQREEMHYVKITQSVLSLIKQQSNTEWIGLGDDCTQMFMARMKQRRAMTCIYSLKDHNDKRVESFDAVAKIMTSYYEEALGTHNNHITHIDNRVIAMGPYLTVDQLCKPFGDQDIKQALSSIPNYKSPRPNGKTADFSRPARHALVL